MADLKQIAEQWDKNRRALKAYGEEFRKLGLTEKDALSLAKKAASLDEAALRKNKEGLKQKAEGLKKVGDVLGQIRAVGGEAFDGLNRALTSFTRGDVKGGITAIADGLAGIAKLLDLVVPGLGEATAAIIKLEAAGANAMVDLAKRTIFENQKITELRNKFDALGSRFNETGASMLAHFDDLASELPQTREQIAAMAEPLIESGIQGDKLAQTIRAQSAAMAMLGERGGQAYASLATRARETGRVFAGARISVSLQEILKTGLNTKDMADALGMSLTQFNTQMQFGSFNARQFGDALDSAMIKKGAKAQASIGVMVSTALAKGQSLIGQLFQYGDNESRQGLDFFGKSLSRFMTLFDQSTTSGKILHETLHDLFEGVLSKAGNVLTNVRIGFKMLESVFLTVKLASAPLYIALARLFRNLDKGSNSGITFTQALTGIGAAASVAAKSLAFMVDSAQKLVELSNRIGKTKIGSAIQTGTSSALGTSSSVLGAFELLAHAKGGVVTGVHNGLATVRAADGEGLASIGPGERIVPANAKSEAGLTIHVEHGAIQIAGHAGQSMLELTEEALDLVLERVALKRGFAR